ncbi:MAG: LURP-one-related family protein [Lachnospiraceae bacterium]|nr:LURP-one-related family protein [Lachnospiraceae bacterium]
MKLMIKQRVLTWADTYDIYDEWGNERYFVKAESFKIGHNIHVYDRHNNEIALIEERFFSITPTYRIEVNGEKVGCIEKKFKFLDIKPEYNVDFNGWRVKGDFPGWNYEVYQDENAIIKIKKELLHWGDTYVVDFNSAQDELYGILLVISIDAANRLGKIDVVDDILDLGFDILDIIDF